MKGKQNSKCGANRRVHRIASLADFFDNVVEVQTHEVRQHESIVKRGVPIGEPRRVGLLPEACDEAAQ